MCVPLSRTQQALGGRKDRQSCTFTPPRHKSIKTCCITAPLLTFTRVVLAKPWQQISAGGNWHTPSELGTLVFSFLGNWSATEPATRNTAPTTVVGEAQGEECAPCQGRDS